MRGGMVSTQVLGRDLTRDRKSCIHRACPGDQTQLSRPYWFSNGEKRRACRRQPCRPELTCTTGGEAWALGSSPWVRSGLSKVGAVSSWFRCCRGCSSSCAWEPRAVEEVFGGLGTETLELVGSRLRRWQERDKLVSLRQDSLPCGSEFKNHS